MCDAAERMVISTINEKGAQEKGNINATDIATAKDKIGGRQMIINLYCRNLVSNRSLPTANSDLRSMIRTLVSPRWTYFVVWPAMYINMFRISYYSLFLGLSFTYVGFDFCKLSCFVMRKVLFCLRIIYICIRPKVRYLVAVDDSQTTLEDLVRAISKNLVPLLEPLTIYTQSQKSIFLKIKFPSLTV